MVGDVASFIKEQLNQGRDVRTIRYYLINRNVNPKIIDSAFDKIYAENSQKEKKSPIEKFVIIGMICLFAILILTGFKIYSNISPFSLPPNDSVTSTPAFEPSTTTDLKVANICDFADLEEKYNCYTLKFEKNQVKCYEISDSEEQAFCYRAQDFYALNA